MCLRVDAVKHRILLLTRSLYGKGNKLKVEKTVDDLGKLASNELLFLHFIILLVCITKFEKNKIVL